MIRYLHPNRTTTPTVPAPTISYSKCTCWRGVDAETGMCGTCWTTYLIRYDVPANRRLDMRRGQEVNLSAIVRDGYVHP